MLGIIQYVIQGYDNLGRRPQGMLGLNMTYSGLVMLVVCAAFARIMFATHNRTWAALVMPALLIALPDSTPPAEILGTNKVSSVWGTATSSVTYAIKIRPDWRTIIPLVVASACGITAYHLALNAGERTTSSGVAALIVALGPATTLALSLAVGLELLRT